MLVNFGLTRRAHRRRPCSRDFGQPQSHGELGRAVLRGGVPRARGDRSRAGEAHRGHGLLRLSS